MSFGTGPGQSPLGYVGTKETNPPQIYKVARAPLTSDFRRYSVGDIWIDTSVPESYICAAISGSTATWTLIGGATTDINLINGDTGSTAGPSVTFTGNNGLECNISGSTATYQFSPVASGYFGSAREFAQAGIQTTDATPTAIATIPLATNETKSVTARITGFRDDYSSSLVGTILYGARTAGAGAIEISPPIVDILEDSASLPSIDADVNSINIRLLVVGVAAQNWNWVVSYDYHGVITNA
jgi:hypothetical protein